MSKFVVIEPEELDCRIEESMRKVISESDERFRREMRVDAYLQKDVLNTADIAKYLGVERETVLHYIRNCDLPAKKKGKQYYIRTTDLDKWLMSESSRDGHPGPTMYWMLPSRDHGATAH